MTTRGKQLTPTDAAYIAGFIDGEGTVSVYRKRYGKVTRPNWNPFFQERVLIVQVNREPLDYILQFFPKGSIRLKKRYDAKHKPCYVLTYTAIQAYNLIKAIHPYLIVKKTVAELLLEYRDNIVKADLHQKTFGGKYTPPEEIERRERIYQACRVANGFNGQPQRLSGKTTKVEATV